MLVVVLVVVLVVLHFRVFLRADLSIEMFVKKEFPAEFRGKRGGGQPSNVKLPGWGCVAAHLHSFSAVAALNWSAKLRGNCIVTVC